MKIRRADMSDAPFIYKLEEEGEYLGGIRSMLYEEILYNDMAHYFVLTEDNQKIGYIGLWLTRPNAEMINIVVQKEHRRKGYGKALVQQAIAFCEDENIDSLTLEVNVNNTPAVKFYETFGFEVVTTRPNYYRNGDDAYLMAKKIGGNS